MDNLLHNPLPPKGLSLSKTNPQNSPSELHDIANKNKL